jgi:hypothetical protein
MLAFNTGILRQIGWAFIKREMWSKEQSSPVLDAIAPLLAVIH